MRDNLNPMRRKSDIDLDAYRSVSYIVIGSALLTGLVGGAVITFVIMRSMGE